MRFSNIPAVHPLVASLEHLADLSPDERTALGALCYGVEPFEAGQPIVRAGNQASRSLLLLEGFVSTSKQIADGKRQIMALYIPGDMPVLMTHPRWALDVDVFAVSDCRIVCFDPGEMWDLCQRIPKFGWLLWECALVAASVHREWIVRVGHQRAISRLAHLFCEMMTRLEAAGLARDGSCDLPLTQAHLSEAIGLSRIHVNRSLQELRKRGLLRFENGSLTILDRVALAKVGDFDPRYLYLSQPRWQAA